ncbi:MAG TPA: nitroreductase family protein [archaeon]
MTELAANRMVTMLDMLRNRRSIRRYRDREIEMEKIELHKEAALRSPSSRGINPGALSSSPIKHCWRGSPGLKRAVAAS